MSRWASYRNAGSGDDIAPEVAVGVLRRHRERRKVVVLVEARLGAAGEVRISDQVGELRIATRLIVRVVVVAGRNPERASTLDDPRARKTPAAGQQIERPVVVQELLIASEGQCVNRLPLEHIAHVEVGVAVVVARNKGVLVVLVTFAAAPTRRVEIIEEVRPRVVDVELQVVAEPLPDVALERVVVGDGVICAAVDDAEQRRGFGVQIVGSQFALWHLIDVDREVQIGAMVPDIREVRTRSYCRSDAPGTKSTDSSSGSGCGTGCNLRCHRGCSAHPVLSASRKIQRQNTAAVIPATPQPGSVVSGVLPVPANWTTGQKTAGGIIDRTATAGGLPCRRRRCPR